jgi:toxin ParE1/3/4
LGRAPIFKTQISTLNLSLSNFDIIAENPQSFESVDFIKPGFRRCVCGVDSIFYKMNDDVVEIMAIIGRQDLNQLT